MRRLLALLVLLPAAYATVWWRTPLGEPSFDPRVEFTDLIPAFRSDGPLPAMGEAVLTGAWELHASNRDFGSYSALGRLADGRLLAVSDKNGALMFDVPGSHYPQRAYIRPLWGVDTRVVRLESDCEALALDPATGDIWTAYEGNEAYWVFSPDFKKRRRVAAPILGEWPGNSGPEAMTRLEDGRFVVILEASTSPFTRTLHPALLYPADPQPNEQPLRFTVAMPTGFRPTEVAALADGRLLVLGRKVTLIGFRSMIAIADPQTIRAGTVMPVREIARIGDRRLRDNYEAMTTRTNPDGSVTIWLMSDNNISAWLQRSLLLELHWRG